jgi:nucleoside-diphosphate-sugar epimerase
MNKPVIAITGAAGFIGSSIARALLENDYNVISLVRKENTTVAGNETRFFDLQVPPPADLLKGADILIHCAFVDHNKNKQASRINYSGTKHLQENAAHNGISKIIFFSTISANATTTSEYGKNKWQLEALFDKGRDVIIKPGLVIGKNGLFGRLLKNILSKKIVPLVNGGKQPIQVVALEDVILATTEIIKNKLAGTYILANTQRFTYREFFRLVAIHYKIKLLYLPLPGRLLSIVIGIATAAGISLPVGKENIKSLESLEYTDPLESLEKLKIQPQLLEDILKGLSSL